MQGPVAALFGVGRQFILGIAQESGYKAGRRCHRPARFHSAQPRCHRTTTGIASDANMLLIDLGTREQVIERAHAIPCAPSAKELTD